MTLLLFNHNILRHLFFVFVGSGEPISGCRLFHKDPLHFNLRLVLGSVYSMNCLRLGGSKQTSLFYNKTLSLWAHVSRGLDFFCLSPQKGVEMPNQYGLFSQVYLAFIVLLTLQLSPIFLAPFFYVRVCVSIQFSLFHEKSFCLEKKQGKQQGKKVKSGVFFVCCNY